MRHRTLVSVFSTLMLSACSITPRDGQYTCPAPEHACPSGMFCDTSDVCRTDTPTDAGIDVLQADVGDVGETDSAVPPGTDAGCIDRDGDGECAGIGPGTDCNDTDDTIGPHVAETCTPRRRAGTGSSAVDENCNGAIDEGCGWFFGTPHPVIRAHVGEGTHFAAALSGDGLRVYTVAGSAGAGTAIRMVDRSALAAPLGEAADVPGTALPGVTHTLVTVTGDELELFSQSDATVLHFARPNTTEPFVRVPDSLVVLGAERVFHPSVTADGLELFVSIEGTAGRRVHRLARTSRDAPFGPPEDVVAGELATISPDGHDLFVNQTVMHRADRNAGFAASAPTALSPFPSGVVTTTYATNYVPLTRELWISAVHPWSAAGGSIWRVQVCRDGACLAASETRASCMAPASSSPDGFHCYYAGASARPPLHGMPIIRLRGHGPLPCGARTARRSERRILGRSGRHRRRRLLGQPGAFCRRTVVVIPQRRPGRDRQRHLRNDQHHRRADGALRTGGLAHVVTSAGRGAAGSASRMLGPQ